jgi:hypothetical protein
MPLSRQSGHLDQISMHLGGLDPQVGHRPRAATREFLETKYVAKNL